ncbi:MAG: hypothetical protein MUO17_06505 [Dehalococcoidales bacterium]|nr:hypothetical protein [Dehalococcoidales bacterium]
MNWLEYPNKELWESRQRWFEERGEYYQGEGSYFVSEQACALIGEVQTAFCAGAWIAVIVLTMAVVDSQLREFAPGFAGSTKRLLADAKANPKLQQLRERRNAIIHIDPLNPAITVDQQWVNRKELEQEARQTVELMFEAFYLDPGT